MGAPATSHTALASLGHAGRFAASALVAVVSALGAGCLTELDAPATYEWVDPDGDKAGGVPSWLEPAELHFRFRVPADTYLYESALVDVYTLMQTEIRLTATPRLLRIDAPLFIDILGPINEALTRVEYDFASGQVSVFFSTSDVGLDWQGEIKASLQAAVTGAVAGTRMARRGYNPVLDPNIAETLSGVAGGIFAGATTDRQAPFDLSKAEQLGVRASFVLREDKAIMEGPGNGIKLCEGYVIELESDNDFQWPEGSNLQALIDADSLPALVAALGIEDLTVRSYLRDAHGLPAKYSGLEIVADGKAVAYLQDVRIVGDGLELRTWFLAGAAYNSAVLEKAFLGLFFGKDPRTAEARVERRGGIIKGLVAERLQDGLSVALRRLIYKHRGAIAGIDLPSVLQMSPPPARATP